MVLVNGYEGRHAGAALKFPANEVAGAFRCDHDDVDIGRRHYLVIVNIEAVRKNEGFALLQSALDLALVKFSLKVVLGKYLYNVGVSGRLCGAHRLEAVFYGKLVIRCPFKLGNDDIYTAVAQILRLGVSLAPITNYSDLAVFKNFKIRIFVVIDLSHLLPPLIRFFLLSSTFSRPAPWRSGRCVQVP